jgi:hypothetical protein
MTDGQDTGGQTTGRRNRTGQTADRAVRRRELLAGLGGGALAAGASGRGTAASQSTGPGDSGDSEGPIFESEFDSHAPGEVPSEFVLVGNTNQAVTDTGSPETTQSYQMDGSYGGCWRAIMRRELFDSGTRPDTMRVRGQFRLDDGQVGCHENKSGSIGWRTVEGSHWSDGSGARLLQFRPDGTVTSAGETVGRYEQYEWTGFEVEYRWDRDSGEVTHTCTVGGSGTETVTREARDDETDLTVLELRSDDFTVFWSGLSVAEPGGNSGLDSTLLLPFVLLVAGGAGYYYLRRRESPAPQQTGPHAGQRSNRQTGQPNGPQPPRGRSDRRGGGGRPQTPDHGRQHTDRRSAPDEQRTSDGRHTDRQRPPDEQRTPETERGSDGQRTDRQRDPETGRRSAERGGPSDGETR